MGISFKKGNGLFFLITTIIYLFTVFVLPSILVEVGVQNVDNRLKIILGAGTITSIILIIYSMKSKNLIENSGIRKNIFISILIGFAGFLTIMFLQGTLSAILQLLSKLYGFNPVSENTSNLSNVMKVKPAFILYAVLLAPIMEEIFFRKALFGYLYDILDISNKFVKFLIPGLITGVLFALPHDGFSPIMIVYVILSLCFSYMYIYTKRIITPIIAHILMNTLVVVVQVFLV